MALSVYVVILHLHRCYSWSFVPKDDFEAHLSIIIALASINLPKEQTSMRNRASDFFSNGSWTAVFYLLYLFSMVCSWCWKYIICILKNKEGHRCLYHAITCNWNNIYILRLLRIAWDKEVPSMSANEELRLLPASISQLVVIVTSWGYLKNTMTCLLECQILLTIVLWTANLAFRYLPHTL